MPDPAHPSDPNTPYTSDTPWKSHTVTILWAGPSFVKLNYIKLSIIKLEKADLLAIAVSIINAIALEFTPLMYRYNATILTFTAEI